MATTITSSGNTIKVDTGNDEFTFETQGILVTLNQEDETIRIASDGDGVSFKYSDVVVPVTASAEALRDAIVAMIPLGSGPVGNVAVTSSALPTGAATEATLALVKDNQTNRTQLTKIVSDNDSVEVTNGALHSKLKYVGDDAIDLGKGTNAQSIPVVISDEMSALVGSPTTEAITIQGNESGIPIQVKSNNEFLARETGNLASILTGIGAPSDVAATVGGDGSVIAILKLCASLLNDIKTNTTP